jgi:hypothetical protein
MTLSGRLDLHGRVRLKTAAKAWPAHTLAQLLALSGVLVADPRNDLAPAWVRLNQSLDSKKPAPVAGARTH